MAPSELITLVGLEHGPGGWRYYIGGRAPTFGEWRKRRTHAMRDLQQRIGELHLTNWGYGPDRVK